MNGLLTFVITLIVLVLFHEIGHFLAAKLFRIRILEFGFGFPPKIKSIKKGETEYSFNLIPLGGFVRLHGEDGKHQQDKSSFAYKAWWKKLIVVSAGVAFNFLLAAVVLIIGYNLGMPRIISDYSKVADSGVKNQVTILEVEESSPAEGISLKKGDIILEVNQQKISDTEDFQDTLKECAGQEVLIGFERDDRSLEKKVEIRSEGKALLGVTIMNNQIYRFSFLKSLWIGVRETGVIIGFIAVAIYSLVADLVVSGTVSGDAAGPVGIFFLAVSVSKLGFVYILQFIALLSINLGLVNLFPFPALDGGRIIFALLEGARGKRINPALENTIHMIGFLILIAFIVLIFARDIVRIPYYQSILK